MNTGDQSMMCLPGDFLRFRRLAFMSRRTARPERNHLRLVRNRHARQEQQGQNKPRDRHVDCLQQYEVQDARKRRASSKRDPNFDALQGRMRLWRIETIQARTIRKRTTSYSGNDDRRDATACRSLATAFKRRRSSAFSSAGPTLGFVQTGSSKVAEIKAEGSLDLASVHELSCRKG
jgi:hypothetical protein